MAITMEKKAKCINTEASLTLGVLIFFSLFIPLPKCISKVAREGVNPLVASTCSSLSSCFVKFVFSNVDPNVLSFQRSDSRPHLTTPDFHISVNYWDFFPPNDVNNNCYYFYY